MGTDRDAALPGDGKGPRHHLGIAGMEPAGHIGRRDNRKHGVIVTAAISPKTFA